MMPRPGGRAEIERAFTALGSAWPAGRRRGRVRRWRCSDGHGYDAARVTRDVDAAFKPHGIVLEEARKVADDLGLPFKPWAVREIKDFQNGPCCLLPASPSVSPRPSR
jgi:hypothetical protein